MTLKLFQYWDGPSPPAEVSAWIEGFRTRNPEFEHLLFDEGSAKAFIQRWFGSREAQAFEACAVPAMQADFIRLCALLVHGGVYIDADNQCVGSLRELIGRAPHALMFTWMGLVNNGFLWFKEPSDPFLRACLTLTVENIEARRFTTGFITTGPGVLNAIRALIRPEDLPEIQQAFDNPVCRLWQFPELLETARVSVEVTPELERSYSAITFMNALAAGPWIAADQPEYKSTKRHWLNWDGSIYR